MGMSFADILKALIDYRDVPFGTEPEREAARLEAIEFALQSMLEKLRDIHDKK